MRQLTGKRILGLLSWRRRRRHEHRTHVLEALLEDLAATAPDHVAVTGDLTNLGLAGEFAAAEVWLRRLGDASHVSVVPGNHDAYVERPRADTWGLWSAYMESDARQPESDTGPGDEAPASAPTGVPDFPTVRIRDGVALVGLCSALPTPMFLATGRVGERQRERLEGQLSTLAAAGLCRVVLIHHPPVAGTLSHRRRLTDAAGLCQVLARAGAELVLHGHTHRATRAQLPGPRGTIPVVGVPSSSAIGHRPERRARYHVYRIAPTPERSGFRISCRVRGLDADSGRFVAMGEHEL